LWAPVPPPLGGISRWTQRFVTASPDYGLDTRVVNIAPPVGAFSESSRLDAGRIGVATRALRELSGVLRRERPAVCHVTTSLFWATPRDALTLALCKAHRVPSLLNLRSSSQIIEWRERLDPLRRAGLDATLRMADCVVVLAAELENYLRSEVRGLRVERIANMIADLERGIGTAAPAESVLPARRSPFRVLFVGAKTPLKGVGELADAVAALPDCELAIVGGPGGAIDAEMNRRMDASLARLRETGRLIETGELSPADVTRAYREADAFVLATHREGLPNTLLEAMASGLPCIATPIGAIPEVLEDGCGILVPVGDPEALRAAIAARMSDPAGSQELTRRAGQRIAERYSVNAVMSRYRALYRELAGLAPDPTVGDAAHVSR